MDLDTILDALPDSRRTAVAEFLDSPVGECPDCARPVTYSQRRAARKDLGICHVDCSEIADAPAE